MLSRLSSLSISSLRKLEMKRLINAMIENTICMKQLSLLGVILSMLFVRILILK